MQLKDVVAISGMGGLFKVVGKRTSGLIVESLDESKKRFPTTAAQKISVLEDVSIYTLEGEERLGKVFSSIKNKESEGLAIPDKKTDDQTLRDFIKAVLPEYDQARVYVSDIKKLANWYSLIKNELDWEALEKSLTETGNETSEEVKDEVKTVTKKPAARQIEKKVSTPRTTNVKSQTSAPRKTGGV